MDVVFSPWESFPFRIEFSGNEVVSLRTFDITSQRSKTKIERLIIPSLREFRGDPVFLEEWTRVARQKVDQPRLKDLEEKTGDLKKGEIFPSFSFLSLFHGECFSSFKGYLKDYLFIIDDLEAVAKDWEETYGVLEEQFDEISAQGKVTLSPAKIYSPPCGIKSGRMPSNWMSWHRRMTGKCFVFLFNRPLDFRIRSHFS